MLYYFHNKQDQEVDMMSVKLNLGAWRSVFAVPSKVVDEGLKFSDGVKLKVLLFVLRNSDNDIDDSTISKATGVNVTDIPEALDYWVNMGILQKSEDTYALAQNNSDNEIKLSDNNSAREISLINNNSKEEIKYKTNEPEKPETVQEISAQVNEAKQHFAVTKPQKPDYVFTSQRLAVDSELRILVEEAQSALGKTLSNSDCSTLLMLKDTCGLPLDVILMLIQYCISIDKGNMRTIEKVGVSWADDGIYSVEAADNKIRLTKQLNTYFSIVSTAFGIQNIGSPTKKQLEYSQKWVGEWKFSPEMLREAYERCVDQKGTVKFNYIDGILKRWNAGNIKTIEELKKSEQKSDAKMSSRKASYDIDELEKINILDD